MKKKLILMAFLGACFVSNAQQNIFQGFWWDYHHNNYNNNWSSYLSDLAPRLAALGVTNVWIPPATKEGAGPGNGYAPFDHYDLGDKFQKSYLETRLGNKNQMLRMVGVLHSNGLRVTADIVFNHTGNAGNAMGDGGIDPAAPLDMNFLHQYKNFRYTSFGSPLVTDSENEYLSRSGRFSKNHWNFHPNPWHGYQYPEQAEMFGPDNCFHPNAVGFSSNAIYNPVQPANYMHDQLIAWARWYKLQTGIDGFRIDAAKHFPASFTRDFLEDINANAGGYDVAVCEYPPEPGYSQDGFVNAVAGGGGPDVGTFDFDYRNAIYQALEQDGFYDLSNLPAAQQSQREHTVPFVNNHDTFRPILTANGQYMGFEATILGPPINPDTEEGLGFAYAAIAAVDGTPQFFFEDLFDLTDGNRFTHDPATLSVRDDVANVLWCSNVLGFQNGQYFVRSSETFIPGPPDQGAYFMPGSSPQDALVIERDGIAIIGLNDRRDGMAQEVWISTNLPPGMLRNYTSHGPPWTEVFADGRVLITIPSIPNGGYVIFAPDGFDGIIPNPAPLATTQVWEMREDMGDSNLSSLREGGEIPGTNGSIRHVGRIYAQAGEQVSISVIKVGQNLAGLGNCPDPDYDCRSLRVTVRDPDGDIIATDRDYGPLALNFNPASTGWHSIYLREPFIGGLFRDEYDAIVTVTYSAAPELMAADVNDRELYFTVERDRQWAEEEQQAEGLPVKLTTEVSISPNPVLRSHPYGRVNVNTLQSSTVTIMLYDDRGNEIKTLAKDLPLNAGMNSFPFECPSHPYLLYKVSVKTKEGEEFFNGKILIE